MASSRSSTAGILQRNDAIFEMYKPPAGFVDIEIIFFHGFQSGSDKDAYLKTWMLADGSACWLNTWLTEDFTRARILSVSYDSSAQMSDSTGRMDMYVVGENLAQSSIGLEGVGQTCPVVLVGHCIGGLVLKQVCLQAEELGARHIGPGLNPYKSFLGNMKGTFFYSTPNSGSPVTPHSKQRGPLLQYMDLLSKNAARLNNNFAQLRRKHGWKAFGVCEANETESSRSMIQMPHPNGRLLGWKGKRLSSVVVEEGAARYDVDDFCVLSGEDNFTICKPRDRRSNNYLCLVNFIRQILDVQEWVQERWESTLSLPRVFVNMPSQVELVIERLNLGKAEPSCIALVGMGGLGKTTLAKAVLKQIRAQFDFNCFLEDVKDRLKSHSAHLNDLIADNLYNAGGQKLGDVQWLWLHSRGKKGIIIIDDVESEDQISGLLASKWLGPGSVLMVTSRIQSRDLLPSFSICKIPFLHKDESMRLFSAHLEANVAQGIPEELIEKVMLKCDGLPLTLAVIGSYLRFQNDIQFWISALDKLKKAESLSGDADDRLWAKLKVSLGSLAAQELSMFLDLAVFDNRDSQEGQYDLRVWKAVWQAGPVGLSVDSCLRNLVGRSLIVTRLADTTLWMHEQLRDLGRSISRPPNHNLELCRGVWQSDDVAQLLNNNKGDEAKTQVLSVSPDPRNRTNSSFSQSYTWKAIAKLQKLRLLRLSKLIMTGNNTHRFPCELTFLHIDSCTKDPAGPLEILKFWQFGSACWPIRKHDVGRLHQLAVLILDNCSIVRLPPNFYKLSKLKVLIICGTELNHLPQKFGCLPSLEVLRLENVVLSHSILELSSLQTLTLKGCSILKPEFFFKPVASKGILCNLTKLTLEDLQNLTELPDTLGLLQSLDILNILKCSALKHLPEGIGNLHTLRTLIIEDSPRLQCLPESVGHLQALTNLLLVSLNLVNLPESLGDLEKLRILQIIGCRDLQYLPESLWNMESLCILASRNLLRWPQSVRNFPKIYNSYSRYYRYKTMSGYTLGNLPEGIRFVRLGSQLIRMQHDRNDDFQLLAIENQCSRLGKWNLQIRLQISLRKSTMRRQPYLTRNYLLPKEIVEQMRDHRR